MKEVDIATTHFDEDKAMNKGKESLEGLGGPMARREGLLLSWGRWVMLISNTTKLVRARW